MRVTAIPIVTDALRTVLKNLKKRQEDLEIWVRIESIQTTSFLRYWEESWRIVVTQAPVKRPPFKAGLKILQGVI